MIELIHLLLSSISTIISIVAISLTIRQYYLSKRVNILRPHSDRLAEVFETWLESRLFLPSVLNPKNIPEDATLISLPTPKGDLSALPFAVEHLKTGYQEQYRLLKSLEERVSKHNDRMERFVQSLCEDIKRDLGLPEAPAEPSYAYYRRIVVKILSKISSGYPKGELKIEEIKRNGKKWRLEWDGSSLVVGTEEDCRKAQSIVKKYCTSEEIVNRTKEFLKDAEILEKGRVLLEESLRVNLVSKIKIGDIIKGKCEACTDTDVLSFKLPK